VVRFIDMCFSVFKYQKQTDVILIDTYSTLNFYYALGVSICAQIVRLPYIPILHGGDLPLRLRNDSKKSKFLFNRAMCNVSPSFYLKEKFEEFGYFNIITIPNTISLKHYPFKPKVSSKNILWVRSFSKIYNPMLAIKVVEQMLSKHPDIKLCMVGPEKDGSLKECKNYAERKSLPVTFTGKLSKEEWIKISENFSIFLNTTNFDNTPVSIIEAMVLGFSIVSTSVGGIPYLLEHRKDALLVPPNSDSAFVEVLEELFSDSDLPKKLSENARIKAEKFDWEIVKQKWFEILN